MPRIPLTLRRCMLLPMAGALASSVGVQAAELTFDLKIEHGQVAQNMRLIRVKQRDVVKLRWGTDQPLTLHLHGYNIEKHVAPNATTELNFTAYATGRFPIEIHGSATGAGGDVHQGLPLAVIEVYPR